MASFHEINSHKINCHQTNSHEINWATVKAGTQNGSNVDLHRKSYRNDAGSHDQR